MANMLYNGVELPDINEVYTDALKSQYPYAVIWQDNGNQGYCFYFGDQLLTYKTDRSIYNLSGVTWYGKWYYCSNGDSAWSTPKYGTSINISNNDGYNNVTLVWASYNVYDENSNLAMSGSDPVDPNAPAYTYDRTAFLSGLTMGLCGKGNPTFEGSDVFTKGYLAGAELRAKRRLPVAYLYNGVKLPKLPEWDKVAHPYALIRTQWNNDDGSFRLAYFNTFASNARYNSSDSGGCIFGGRDGGESVAGQVCSITSPDGSWGSLTTYDDGSVVIPPPEGSDFRGIYTEYLTWANFKVKYDGVVYMEASEPIPVYE